jgi:hypothetical protein
VIFSAYAPPAPNVEVGDSDRGVCRRSWPGRGGLVGDSAGLVLGCLPLQPVTGGLVLPSPRRRSGVYFLRGRAAAVTGGVLTLPELEDDAVAGATYRGHIGTASLLRGIAAAPRVISPLTLRSAAKCTRGSM